MNIFIAEDKIADQFLTLWRWDTISEKILYLSQKTYEYIILAVGTGMVLAQFGNYLSQRRNAQPQPTNLQVNNVAVIIDDTPKKQPKKLKFHIWNLQIYHLHCEEYD